MIVQKTFYQIEPWLSNSAASLKKYDKNLKMISITNDFNELFFHLRPKGLRMYNINDS
jgi:hypothetical protein